MLSLAMRRKPAAELLQAVRPTCGHARPGTGYRLPAIISSGDSCFQNAEGSP
jgi:hypothetical protein